MMRACVRERECVCCYEMLYNERYGRTERFNILHRTLQLTFQLHTVVRMDTTFPNVCINSSTASSWDHPHICSCRWVGLHVLLPFLSIIYLGMSLAVYHGSSFTMVNVLVCFTKTVWVYVAVVVTPLIFGLRALWKPNRFICSPVVEQNSCPLFIIKHIEKFWCLALMLSESLNKRLHTRKKWSNILCSECSWTHTPLAHTQA